MGKEKIFKIMSQIKEEIETQMPFDPYRTRIALYQNRKINEQSEPLKLYKEIEEARVVFEIHQYFNEVFSAYLIQNHLHSPQELTEVHKRAFKSEALTQSDKISENFQQRKRILQIENSINSDHIRAYLFNNIDDLTATLFNTGNLIFEDRELQNQFNLDYELSEFRKTITEQCFDESIMKLPKGESESITECQKIALLWKAHFINRTRFKICSDEERVMLALAKLYLEHSEIIKDEEIRIEIIVISYTDINKIKKNILYLRLIVQPRAMSTIYRPGEKALFCMIPGTN